RGVHVDVGRYPQARYGQQSGSYYRGHGYGGHNDWHDTTHYDYHSGQSYRHGNHSHYEPGHYDLHRGGHYDYHRGGHGGYGHR
ncbi:MAG: hypothetical protein ABI614_16150, partial [Planctomycetota bacterium]